MNKEDFYKMPIIFNIQNMQRALGVTVSSLDSLMEKTLDELHEEQVAKIEHYSWAVKCELE